MAFDNKHFYQIPVTKISVTELSQIRLIW